jgi:hypothetical protein
MDVIVSYRDSDKFALCHDGCSRLVASAATATYPTDEM